MIDCADMSDLPPDAKFFLDEVRDWLVLTRDPRVHLDSDGQSGTIDNLTACSVDFCRFMAEVTEAGMEHNWRGYLADQSASGEVR